ncbi:MAG: hypothetical protein ACFFFB_26775 [Candidatus Heimdallarchaeota archaeon]
MKVLQDIWILDKAGVVLFNRVFKESVSPQLFGAMMSALNSFAEHLTNEGLTNFELENKRFTITKRNNLIFVANSSKQFNQKKVNKEIGKISKKFIKRYSEELKNYQGEIGSFTDFKRYIEDSLEENRE